MKAAILGVTGYTGQLLARLLSAHPQIRELLPVSSSRAGEGMSAVDLGFRDSEGKMAEEGRLLTVEEAAKRKPEVVFSALPHMESAKLCAPFFGQAVVIDLSADFRVKDATAFARAYGEPPPRPDLLDRAVYGLCEWYAEAICKSDLIANPGCYPTATLLPLLPLLKEGLIGGEVHVSAISGISGAGRKVRQEYLFVERSENAGAYNPGKSHRHVCEIEEQLQLVSPGASVLFIPHLAPMRKGMAVTIFAKLSGSGTAGPSAVEERVEAALRLAYGNRPFIGLRGKAIPHTGEVRGSNRCDIGWRREGDTLMLFSVLDNLVKGASGQAVQSMNLRFGFPETAGLPLHSEI